MSILERQKGHIFQRMSVITLVPFDLEVRTITFGKKTDVEGGVRLSQIFGDATYAHTVCGTTTKFGTMWGAYASRSSATPNKFGGVGPQRPKKIVIYIGAHSMRNRNQILKGDQM